MGRMKELLDQRLEENKYEMWEILSKLQSPDMFEDSDYYDLYNRTQKLLSKIQEVSNVG